MLFGGLMMLLFWGALIAIAVVVVRTFTGRGTRYDQTPPSGRKTPLQIVEDRYARGEIEKQEFEAIRDDLSA